MERKYHNRDKDYYNYFPSKRYNNHGKYSDRGYTSHHKRSYDKYDRHHKPHKHKQDVYHTHRGTKTKIYSRSRNRSYSRTRKGKKTNYKHSYDRKYKRRLSHSKSTHYLREKKYRESYSPVIEIKKEVRSPSSSSSSSTSDLDHFKYKVGDMINNKYKILAFLGDGTFGRVVECLNLNNNQTYAVKVIRPVKRYIESAKIEADILETISKADYDDRSHCVKMLEYFHFSKDGNDYFAIVFEKLGSSLYQLIKSNNYKGYPMKMIQQFARQIFEGVGFLHEKLGLTHTDLKPENILLKNPKVDYITKKENWPTNILFKESREKDNSPSTRSYSMEEDAYKIPYDTKIKIIDFGGASFKDEKHSGIINTRQYRAPEVILGCCDWDEKSDVWSIACILPELYSGELLFPTHDNEEHLCLIEKICGSIPHWMAKKSLREFTHLFDFSREEREVYKTRHRISLDNLRKKKEVKKALHDLYMLEEIIMDEHRVFIEFLKFLLIIDPEKRPSCKEALDHEFFYTNFSE